VGFEFVLWIEGVGGKIGGVEEVGETGVGVVGVVGVAEVVRLGFAARKIARWSVCHRAAAVWLASALRLASESHVLQL
jgi:hypothetical protein